MFKYTDANEAYHGMLSHIYDYGVDDGDGNLEVINCGFCIEYPEIVEFKNSVRKFRTDYAKKFFDFIMSGGTDASVLFESNPNAANFVGELAGRNTLYGPRILAQIPAIVEELKARPTSRRAVITILNSQDQVLLPEKQKGSTIEYPCTMSLMFLLRKQELHMHVSMRSNNMVTTINYDLYNFIALQNVMVEKLREAGLEVYLGKYYHACASAHILEPDIDFSKSILEAYEME